MRCPNCTKTEGVRVEDFGAALADNGRTVMRVDRAYECKSCGATWKSREEIYDVRAPA